MTTAAMHPLFLRIDYLIIITVFYFVCASSVFFLVHKQLIVKIFGSIEK
jgi:hypothetical protein